MKYRIVKDAGMWQAEVLGPHGFIAIMNGDEECRFRTAESARREILSRIAEYGQPPIERKRKQIHATEIES